MKTCSKCLLLKDKSKFYLNKTCKDGLEPWCKECRLYAQKNRYLENKEVYTARIKNYRESHKEKRREYYKEYSLINSNKIREKSKRYYEENKSYHLNKNATRRSFEKLAVPNWANKKKIEAIYEFSVIVSKDLKEKFHVDHLIPLRGNNVCGLHVEENLRVIPARSNLSKGNKLNTIEIYGIITLKDIMEKNGRITLTLEELKQYKEGISPIRLLNQWEISEAELKEILDSGMFEVVPQIHNIRDIK